jgi:hypothetical protein
MPVNGTEATTPNSDADWFYLAPTERQLDCLANLAPWFEPLTRGEAADRILEIHMNTAPNKNQLSYLERLERQLGWQLPVPDSITEASKRIKNAKRELRIK